MKKRSRKRCPIFLLCVLSFLVSIGPLGAVFAVNFGEYVRTVDDVVKLGFGALVAVFFMLLKVLGKLKMPRRVVFEALVVLCAWLFSSLLEDLLLLSSMVLVGEVADYLAFQPLIARRCRERERDKAADVTAQKVEEVLAKYVGGGGRV